MILNLRWILWTLGLLGGLAFLFAKISPQVSQKLKSKAFLAEGFAEKRYQRILLGICSGYLALALLEKYSQFYSFKLNANDFWLFVDILEQTKKGGAFLTRFAPQSIGFVQHGSVHPMFTWGLLSPLAFLFPSVHIALWYGPVMFSGAAFLLALLTRKNWGSLGSLLFGFSFLASTQVGKVLLYEVHPEAAYPFFVFLWLWSMGWDGLGRVRTGVAIFAILLGMGIKEDSFLVFGPWVAWSLWKSREEQQKTALLSAVIGAGVMISQFAAVHLWTTGAWGPKEWQGLPVTINASAGAFKGAHWSGLSGIRDVFQVVLNEHQGWTGMLKKICLFLFSRQWWSLLIFAPWVIFNFQFWWMILPLAGMYALLEGPNHLWNYYSAPFLASFWFCAALGSRWGVQKRSLVLWVVISSCLLGSKSIQIEFPTSDDLSLQREVKSLAPCLGGKHGIVAPHLIGWVPFDKIWTERNPKANLERAWSIPDFILVSPQMDRYELSSKDVEEIVARVQKDPRWQKIGPGCVPISQVEEANPSRILLFRKIDSVSR